MKKAKRRGQPTKFDDRYLIEGRRLALLGAKDAEMALFWGISESTLYNWKNTHPQFLEALKSGKEHADATVAESLFKRANGYSHKAVKIFNDRETGVTQVPYTEHYPPDTTAAIFWLKNRRSGEWRDKTDHEHTGTIGFAQLIAETPEKPK